LEKDSRIYVAGHRGLVGSSICRRLKTEEFTRIIARTHAEMDLESQAEVTEFFQTERPEFVFLAAAKVGGIWANATYPAGFIYRNLAIQTNVIHAAWKAGVKRLIFLGSSCIYPCECPQPMKEEYLLTGPLEQTNQPYAVAKIAGIVQCEAYNRQYGTHFLAVMPTNLYGPKDNFDLETSHVLPALIRKFHLGKLAAHGNWEAVADDEKRFGPIPSGLRSSLGLSQDPSQAEASRSGPSGSRVPLWGTGSPRREFLHVDDLADACLFLMRQDTRTFEDLCSGRFGKIEHSAPESSALNGQHSFPLINIGCGRDSSIRELATLVMRVVGYEGEVLWDNTKHDGTTQKLLDVLRLKSMGWSPHIGLEEGISSTYQWYVAQMRCDDDR
jgi:GDP-L-fucose synthase